jgi:hypothetical protein
MRKEERDFERMNVSEIPAEGESNVGAAVGEGSNSLLVSAAKGAMGTDAGPCNRAAAQAWLALP